MDEQHLRRMVEALNGVEDPAVDATPPPHVADLEVEAVLARMTVVVGLRPVAETWFAEPCGWLEHRRPADLVRTPEGLNRVKDYLLRVETGIYG